MKNEIAWSTTPLPRTGLVVIVDDGVQRYHAALPSELVDELVSEVLAEAALAYQDFAPYVGTAPVQCSAQLIFDGVEVGYTEFECEPCPPTLRNL